jgi:hypothetical protein
MMRHLEAEHPYAAGGGQVVGALLPTVLTGGAAAGEEAAGLGARILAHSPAGLAGRLGGAIGGLGEGAGLAGRLAAGTAGAAAEGALYGGGQYLTETALEDKPLSAEGFVAGMGHGALFAAPIGAAGTLASATLQRAASLFPRSEVSAAAAAGVKDQASSALAQTVRDGDQMAAAAERKLSDIDAGTQIAQAGETTTRRVFGAADPQALADQVTGATARQEVAQALQGYQQARQQFEDWMATEADPELEKALTGLAPGELQTPALAAPRVPVGEFGAPGAGGFKSQDELARLAAGSGVEDGAIASREDVTGAGGPRALRGGARGTPAGGVPAEDIVARGMAEQPGTVAGKRIAPASSEQPATAVGKRPAVVAPSPAPREIGEDQFRAMQRDLREKLTPDEIKQSLRFSREHYLDVNRALRGDRPPLDPEAAAQITPALDAVMEKSAVDHPIITHRAIYFDQGTPQYELKPGDVLHDPGFGPTSWRSENIHRFGNVHLVIESPPGTRIAAIPSSASEGELTLARGTSMEITGREVHPDGKVTLRARVVAQDGNPAMPTAPKGAPVVEEGAAASAGGIPTYEHLKAQPEPVVSTVPASVIKERGWYEMPGQGEDAVKAERGQAAIREGQREPIKITVDKDGKLFVSDGRNRLNAAVEQDAPIRVQWEEGTAGSAGDVFKGGPSVAAASPAGDDLLAALGATKSALDKGEDLKSLKEAFEERAGIHEYEGGQPRTEAERLALEDVASMPPRHATEPSDFAESAAVAYKKSPKRVEAARKAAAASVERSREIHSAVASNLPKDLQLAWDKEGYKFMREEAARIRGNKDPISAASNISESFAEKYGSAGESGRGYEGDRYHRRLEIEAKHAESWAKEQELKHHAALAHAAEPPPEDLLAALSGTRAALGRGEGMAAIGRPAAAATRAEQGASASAAAEHFRGQALAARAERAGLGSSEAPWNQGFGASTGGYEGSQMAAEERGLNAEAAGRRADPLAMFGLESDASIPARAGEVPADLRAMMLPDRTAVDAGAKARMGAVREEAQIAKAIMRHNGKNVDIGPRIAREAQVIGDMEGASARLADALGPEAPPTAAANAQAFHAATAKAQDRAAASSAKLGADLKGKVPAMTGGTDATLVDDDVAKALRKHESSAAARASADKTAVSPAPEMPGLGSKAADLGSALEVMRAIGMHVPAVSHIPVIGPILGLWLKARAVMGIIGRKGGSIGKSTEGLIAGKAAAVQDRIVRATGALLEGGARAAGKASHLAGPAVLLAGALFPGGDKPKSDSPRDLFEARSDDITRAMQPGAIDQAIAQRFPTSDPAMHDAIVAQVQRGIAFLDSKRPKQTVLPGVLPGDGTWALSSAAIEEFGKYVHAVNDPVSVLEDLAKGHPSAEGAETLHVVYPELYAYAQKQLLAAAPAMAKTLPYPRRVMLSILYQIPIDGTMQPSHAQFLQTPAPPPPAARPPSTGPLRLGQQTLSPLDQRATGA